MTTHHRPDLRARSPWAALTGVDSVTLSPAPKPIVGELRIPGSKSYTNRALIIAGAALGKSKLSGILRSDDSYWCVDTLKNLGCNVTVDNDSLTIDGTGAEWPKKSGTLYIGAAGTIGRFMPGVLAAAHGGAWDVEASERMSERPIAEVVEALRCLGARIDYLKQDGKFPLRVHGNGLKGGSVTISGKDSSQFLSGVLIASALAENPVKIHVTDGIVQPAYVDMTIDIMRRFGATVSRNESLTELNVSPIKYTGQEIELEADASTSCYFLAAAALTGGRMRITNLGSSTAQPDLEVADLLGKMGCDVKKTTNWTEVHGTGKLKGGFTQSMRSMSDQTLTMAVVSVFADAPVTLTEVAHIRKHESDRIHAICESLGRLGIKTDEHPDGLTIYPGTPKAGTVDSYDDHRVAMSLALTALRTPGITIKNPGCVSKTCPNFFDEMKKLGMEVSLS